jgi:NADH-quinone oxidoreductase subunit N
MIMTPQDYIAALPLGIVAVTAFLVLLIEAFRDGSVRVTSWLTALGLAAAFFVAIRRVFGAAPGTAFFGMYATGAFPDLMTALFCVSGILTVLLSPAYLRKEQLVQGEYYAVLLSAVAGMIMMAAAADLVFFFLGLELMSIAFYILAGFARGRLMSNEAGLKYFLLGAFSTGFLLYGIALVYGATGRTAISAIPSHSLALAH